MIELPYLTQFSPFPPVHTALDEPNGLLAFGADLSEGRLFEAYSKGIFPWFSEQEPLLWWSPDPRSIIELDHFHASKSLRKLVRQQRYQVTLNHAFDKVIAACSTIPRRHPDSDTVSTDTWITSEMQQAYVRLHQAGLAHSVEVWDNNGHLAGGLYGVGVGRIFCGESMFHKATNTSKLAMYALVNHMQNKGMAFIDCQLPTEHLTSLGAQTISREAFISRLREHNETLDSSGNISPEYARHWQKQVITP